MTGAIDTLTSSEQLEAIYVGYFGRGADSGGFSFWEQQYATHVAKGDDSDHILTDIANSFAKQPETNALYPQLAGLTPPFNINSTAQVTAITSFVNSVYENLFGHGLAAGDDYWVDQILNNITPIGTAILGIANGAIGVDVTTIHNKIAVAESFTDQTSEAGLGFGSPTTGYLQEAASVVASTTSDPTSVRTEEAAVSNYISGDTVSVPPPQNITLSTGTDNVVLLVGGTVNAIVDNNAGVTAGGPAQTLNAGDTITGGPGNNVLNVTDYGLGGWIGGSTNLLGSSDITGITTLNISSLEGVAASSGFNFSDALDLTDWTRLTALNITSSDNYYNNIKVGDNTAVSMVASGSSSEYTLIFGGSTITVNNASSEYTYNYITGGSDTTSVSASGQAETYVYDQHNSGNNGYDGGGTTPNWSLGANSIVTYSGSNQDDGSYNYIYSDALTALNLTNVSYTYSYVYAAAGTRALVVNLSNDGNSTNYPGEEVYVQDNTATSVTVTTSGTASHGFSLEAEAATTVTFNDAVGLAFYAGTAAGSQYLYAPLVTSLTIDGAGAFTADLSGLNATAAIDASGSGGAIIVELAGASSGLGTQTFTGDAGQDIVTIGGSQTGHVTGGSASNNEIILNSISSASEINISPSIVSHFSTLGVEGSTSGTFNMSGLPAYTSFDVISSGGDVTFTNVNSGASLSIDNSNSNTITLQTGDMSGASDDATLVIGTSATAGVNVSAVTLDDSSGTGIGTVNIISNGRGAGDNSIALNKSVPTLDLSGIEAIDLGTVTHGAAGITVSGGSDNSAVSLSLAGTTSSGHSDIITLGNGDDVIIDTSAGSGSTVHITLGNGNNVVTVGADATNTVTLGTGQNSVIEAAGGNVAISFGVHGAGTVDNVVAGASTSATIHPSAVISGINIVGSDTVTFSGDAGANTALEFTTTQINAFGSNPTTLAAAVAGVLSASGGNLAQHSIGEFTFQGNTYFVEQAGATGSAFAAGDAVVELTGVQSITSATTAGAGVLHLNG
jgi:S-layer protein